MRHQAEHVALFAEDAGDVVERAVGVCAVGVTEGDAVLALESAQGLVVAAVVAVTVGDRRADDLALAVAAGERTVGRFDAETYFAADEAQAGVAHEHAPQPACLPENLG